MSSNKIYEEFNKKHDFYINNAIKNEMFKDEERINVLKKIYEERNLSSPEKQKLINQYPGILSEVGRRLENKAKKSEIVEYLMEKGISEEQAVNITNRKFETYKQDVEIAKKSKGHWVTAFLVIFLIIRWTMRCSNNY